MGRKRSAWQLSPVDIDFDWLGAIVLLCCSFALNGEQHCPALLGPTDSQRQTKLTLGAVTIGPCKRAVPFDGTVSSSDLAGLQELTLWLQH